MLTVRAMVEADVAAISTIRVTGWKAAYVGIVPQSHLDGMTVEADTRRRRQHFKESKARTMPGATNLVAINSRTKVVGWACFGPIPGAGTPAATGELYALYVQPSLIGSGIGRTLLEAVHARAFARGFGRMRLWVIDANTRARHFYERAGYVPDGAVQADDYDGVSVSEVRYQLAL